MRARNLTLGFVAVCAVQIPLTAFAAVGTIPGSAAVSSTGAAAYQIPIQLPPGPAGVQPSLALVYSSSTGDGIMSHGWDLSGLGAISRCNKTVAQDGAPKRVSLEAGDGYCLNGSRLRLTGGSYGVAGSTYQTEVADFSNVTAYGSAGNGPQYFIVQSKEGRIYEYGASTDSRITPSSSVSEPYTWLLNKVRDRRGNNYVVSYGVGESGSVGVGVPQTISYTPTSFGSTSYKYVLEFDYDTYLAENANTTYTGQAAYIDGSAVVNTNLLKEIRVKGDGALIRKYSLAYETSPTTLRARLHAITECAGSAGSDCLPQTTFSYQNGVVGVSSTADAVVPAFPGYKLYAANSDFNGDGYKDLVFYDSATYKVAFGSASGYGTSVDTGAPVNSLLQMVHGDLIGNGTESLIVPNGSYWSAYTWNGTSFSGTSLSVAYNSDEPTTAGADVNGDGRLDLIKQQIVPYGSSAGFYAYVYLATSSANTPSLSPTPIDALYRVGDSCGMVGISAGLFGRSQRLDFDGDGREDLVMTCNTPSGAAQLLAMFDGTSFSSALIAASSSGFAEFPDWNGDGCSDVATVDKVYLSGCDGTLQSEIAIGYGSHYVIDWNGDGRMDLLEHVGSEATYSVRISTGTGTTAALPTSIPYDYSFDGLLYTADTNGDGLYELLRSSQSNFSVSRYVHNGANEPPDLLTVVTDGYQRTVSFSYTSMVRSSYSRQTTGSYPDADWVAPMYVVQTMQAPDGIGGTYTSTFNYEGARFNKAGRGFLGFEIKEETDSRNSIKTRTTYRREFPYSGSEIKSEVFQANGTTLISKAVTVLADTVLDATANNERHFVHADSIHRESYELGGPLNGSKINDEDTSLVFDSWGNVTSSVATKTDRDPGSPYYGVVWTTSSSVTVTPDYGSNWCLNIPSATTTTYSASNGEATVVRSMAFTPEYADCRVSQQITEPGSSNRRIVESFGYDNFGNLSSVATTGRTAAGADMPTRTTSAGWGTTGQFPISSTNALSQTTTRTYNSAFGLIATETDPNGLQMSRSYDAFGRLVREQRVDGTATNILIQSCSAVSGGCQNGDPTNGTTGLNQAVVISTQVDTGNNPIRDEQVYLDQFDRPIVKKTKLLSGAYSRVGMEYDSLGRLVKQSVPCEGGNCADFWMTAVYDTAGRVVQQRRPTSASDSTVQTTVTAYQGDFLTVTDSQGKTTTKITDPRGVLRRSQDHNGYYQTFGYDAFGTLISVSDSLSNALLSASYTYAKGPLQTASSDMDMGSKSYSYNSLGELTGWTDAKGQSFTQTYDALSRLLTRTEAEGTTTWAYGTSASNHNIGQLAAVSSPSYAESRTYDSLGRPASRQITTDATYTYDYSYDSTTGAVASLTYPTSTSSYRLKLQYLYQNGQLSQIKDFNASTVFWQANAQNALGQITQEIIGNGVVTTRSFDAVTGRVGAIQSGVGGGASLQNASYLYDAVGNVTQRQNNNAGLTESFFYDNLYRLDHSTLQSPSGTATNLALTYDAMGNILSRSDVAGGASWTYHGSKKHAVIQAGNAGLTYSYDANGNATARFGHAITWTSYNYPSTIYGADKTLEFQYGPDRQRFKQIYTSGAGVETTMYVGDLLEKVTSGGITAWRHYVKAGGQTIAVINRLSTGTNSTRYVLEDHQGSYDQILESSGGLYVSESFSAYGARRDPNAWTNDCLCDDLSKIKNFSRRGYTGHEAIGGVSMGLNHMNGRVQDAMSGRFLSPDPYVPSPELTQSFNRFSYVLNNPLSYSDPSGFMEEVTVTGYRDSNDLQFAFGFDAGNSWSFVGLFRTDGWTAADTPPPEVMEEVTVVGKTPPKSGKQGAPQSQQCTKADSGWSVLDSLPMFDLPSLPDGFVDFSAGLGDALLFGTGDWARDQLGVNSVDTTAGAYSAGSWTSFGFGAGRLGYAVVAKGYSIAATSGAAASAFRSSMRMPGAPVRDLTKYGTDAALRAAAGRTNPFVNAAGAGVAAAGAHGATAGCP